MSAVDIYVAYKFIKILATPWKRTDAYKLGIIDKDGVLLKKKSELETSEEKKAYTIFHRLIWNIKRLLDKLPGGKTRIGSFAAALWMLKEHAKSRGVSDPNHIIVDSFTDYLIENNIMTKYEVDSQITNTIFESSLMEANNILKKGRYRINKDLDTPTFKSAKGDVVEVPKDLKAFTTILGVPVFKIKDKKLNKELVLSHEDLERI